MTNPLQSNSLVQKVAVRTAVNASLWACGVISVPLFYFTTRITGWIQIALFVVALAPVGSFVFSYFYLLFKNPEYLRSEGYQLRAQSLRLLGEKDNPFGTKATDVVSVTNPALPAPNLQQENE